MSVTFKTQALIDAAQAAVEAQEAAKEEWAVMVQEAKAEHYEKWLHEHMGGVRALRDYLSRCLKDGRAPDHAKACDLMNRRHGELYFYQELGGFSHLTKPAALNLRIGDYPGLIKMLKAHVGDTISANELKLVGYDRLTNLFYDAAQVEGATV